MSAVTARVIDINIDDACVSPSETSKESQITIKPDRHHTNIRSWLTIVTCTLIVGGTGVLVYDLVQKVVYEYNEPWAFFVLAFVCIMPFMISFAVHTIVGNIFTMIYPINVLARNTQYYSAYRSVMSDIRALRDLDLECQVRSPSQHMSMHASFVRHLRYDSISPQQTCNVVPTSSHSLLPVVIHMPVYKESLSQVIHQSCKYLVMACEYYKRQGGACKIIISDDGMQLLDPTKRQRRIDYYNSIGIGWVARPPQDRVGIFKKASNMNYTYKMGAIVKDNATLPADCMCGGDFTIEDNALILLIDADTVVPETCIADTVWEFMETPDLPYTQHFTMPFVIPEKEKWNYWLGMITYLTEKIYFMGIAYSTALGGACPIVGHNVFIRFSALKEVGYWSENAVSEDFDFFLKLARGGRFGRFVMYTGSEFREGVSLTFVDEIVKFKKFKYGACELFFEPFSRWLCRGPFRSSFYSVMASKMSWHDKLNVIFYLSTYFAMSSAFYFMVAEGALSIWYPELHERYLVTSVDVMLVCVAVFAGTSTLSQIIFDIKAAKYPHGTSLLIILWDEIKWIPFISIFFSGLLFHMTCTAFRYFVGMPVSWGATVKEKQKTKNFIMAIWQNIRMFWVMYVIMTSILAAYAYFVATQQIPWHRSWAVFYYCSAHIMTPILFDMDVMLLRT
jgi:hypothetical protein